MIKVCIATTAFPRWQGDNHGIFIYEAARALNAAGNHVIVISMHTPGSDVMEEWDGIKIFRPRYFPSRWETLRQEMAGIPAAWEKSLIARLSLLPLLLSQAITIARHAASCDIIHANWTISAAAALLSKFVHRTPIVVTIQGSDIFRASKIGIIKWGTKKVLNASDRIIALSKALSVAAINIGVTSTKIETIPNGVNTALFKPGNSASREPIILYVGSLIQRKGVKYLIDSMKMVINDFPEARLLIAGEGPQRANYEDQTRELHLQDHVQFLGAISQDDVRQLMKRASVFSLPSLEEGLGVVLLEALASGTPCIASNIGGIPDIVSPDVGILVPPRNSLDLANSIKILLSDPIAWNEYSKSARNRAVIHFDWNIIASRIVEIYQKIQLSKSDIYQS
jgi:glycosyltransferase involved in cell wall biosynthesis